MTIRSYLRPVGRLVPPPAGAGAQADRIVRIGGRDDLVFAAFELIDRRPGGTTDRRIVTPAELEHEIARGDRRAEQLRAWRDGIDARRPPLAGLPLDRPRIMGIVNVTPDSFSDGGSFSHAGQAIAFARRLVDEGTEVLDIGGESTRPGSDPVSLDEELRRVMPVIEGLAGKVGARLSVDTRKPEVMRRAAEAGAHLLNDVSALQYQPDSLAVAAGTGLPVVLMHALGDPKTMQHDPRYDDVVLDVFDALAARVAACEQAGIPRARIVVDPGIGFGKTLDHNLALLAGLSIFHGLGVPILLGASRKSSIGRLTGAADPADRVPGSIAAALAGAMQGVAILRVHDVAETRQALTVWDAACRGAGAAA
jgi:dihydropteroate synthase